MEDGRRSVAVDIRSKNSLTVSESVFGSLGGGGESSCVGSVLLPEVSSV